MESKKATVARIQKAKADLYVYGDSPAKEKWRDLLDQAYEAVIFGDEAHAEILIERCEKATSNLWSRISRWANIQSFLTVGFGLLLALEICLIAIFFEQIIEPSFGNHYIAIIFGFLGGTASTLMSVGSNLSIEGSNRLGLIQTLVRPLIGTFNGLFAVMLITTGILTIPNVQPSSELVGIVGVAAGLTERFVTNQLSAMIN